MGADYFESVRTLYQGRRDVVHEALEQIEGVVCPKPRGAFYAFAKFPVDDIDRFCRWLLTDFTEQSNQTVAMAPGPGFYTTPGRGQNEARLAYVLNEKAMSAAIAILKRALDVYPGRA